MAKAQLPEGLTADYANTGVRESIDALQSTPDHAHLAAFLTALREELLIVDVTGTAKKKATHIRTIRSTSGQLVLPLFTSMAELRKAQPTGRADAAKGAMMPALEALRMIETKPFVAAQFDLGSTPLMVVRKYLELALGGEEITAELLEGMA